MSETVSTPQAECPQCGLRLAKAEPVCPACGQKWKGPLVPESANPWILAYFKTLWEVIVRPNTFFRQMKLTGGISAPLAFALITHWLGAALSFVWAHLFGKWMSVYWDTFFRIAGDVATLDRSQSALPWEQMISWRDRFFDWFWGVGSIVIDPFLTLLSLLISSTLVFCGAALLASPRHATRSLDLDSVQKPAPTPVKVTFESALRLLCYGMSPTILSGIPLFGWGLASLLTFIITVVGAKEVYRVGTFRGLVIVLFPKLVYLALFCLGLLVAAIFFMKFLTAFF